MATLAKISISAVRYLTIFLLTIFMVNCGTGVDNLDELQPPEIYIHPSLEKMHDLSPEIEREMEKIRSLSVHQKIAESADVEEDPYLAYLIGGTGFDRVRITQLGNNGEVLGTYSADSKPYVWTKDNGMLDVESAIAAELSPVNSMDIQLLDINDEGEILGFGYLGTLDLPDPVAFIWKPGSPIQLVQDYYSKASDPGSRYPFALTIDNRVYANAIFRIPDTITEVQEAYVLGTGETMTKLYDSGEQLYFGGFDASDNGIVLGRLYNNQGQKPKAFFNEQTGVVSVLPTTTGSAPLFYDGVTRSGTLFGTTRTSTGAAIPFTDDNGDGVISSYTIPSGTFGLIERLGYVNDNGEATGSFLSSAGYQPVIWSADGVPEVIPIEGATIYLMYRINDARQSIGWGTPVGGGQFEFYMIDPPVADTIPPVISYVQLVEELFPANNELVMSVSGINAVDETDPAPVVTVDVTSNEPADPSDIVVVQETDGSYTVTLRASRDSKGDGRTYSMEITATDAAGNVAEEIVSILVPQRFTPDPPGRPDNPGNGKGNGPKN